MTDFSSDFAAAAEPFRLGNVFARSLGIFGRRSVTLLLLTVLTSIPYGVAVLGLSADPLNPAPAISAVYLLKLVTRALAGGVVTYGVLQDVRGHRFSLVGSLSVVLGRLLPLIGIVICVWVGICFGLIVLVVPGIMLACRWYLAAPVCIAERRGVFDSMARSRDLTEGHRWQVFGAVMVIGVTDWIVAATLYLALLRFGLFMKIVALAWGVLLGTFNAVLVAVFYYELRVAKEGVDIDKIASVFD